ncbi:MAG: aspartyl protease family protein [Leptospiraceae bacterium]|nr:aspartyl protease family protein [Leptospiraceae bacterium]
MNNRQIDARARFLLRMLTSGLLLLLSSCSSLQAVRLLQGGSPASDPPGPVQIPLRRMGYHYGITPVRVNTLQTPYLFLFDSGAHNALAWPTAAAARFKPEVTVDARDSNNRSQPIAIGKLAGLHFGSITLLNTAAVQMDLQPMAGMVGGRWDGIIGSNSLQFFSTEIDLNAGLLILNPADLGGPFVLQTELHTNLMTAWRPGFTITRGSDSYDFIIDTGAYLSLLDYATFRSHCQAGSLSAVDSLGSISGFSKTHKELYFCRLNWNPLDPAANTGLPVYLRKDNGENLLGLTALINYRVAIDFPQGRLLVRTAAKTWTWHYAGFTVFLSKGAIKVHKINQNCAAWNHGLRTEMPLLQLANTRLHTADMQSVVKTLENPLVHRLVTRLPNGTLQSMDY